MEELMIKLKSVPDAYEDFVYLVERYAKIKESHLELILDYLKQNPSATTSDIIYLISVQPDIYDYQVQIKESQYVG